MVVNMAKKVGIIGATGYAGLEIARLLASHPDVELAAISSVSFEGKTLPQVYPNMAGLLEQTLVSDSEVLERCEVVFASLPHGLSQEIAAVCCAQNKLFIDMGADFRLHDEADYKQWYGGTYTDPALHEKAVYAIPELFREKIRGAKLIANPGCYPTSIALGLAPLLRAKNVHMRSIIIDAKSGVTGAGRGLTQNTHYPDCNEAFAPYKVAEHRHTPEIEQILTALAKEQAFVTFVPHLLPVNRGILSTMYVAPRQMRTLQELHDLYTRFYAGEKFVRILPQGAIANIRNVKYSNYCDVSLHIDERAGRVIVVSAIDNMVKGAAGQAIQNMNLACGFAEDAGLCLTPPAF